LRFWSRTAVRQSIYIGAALLIIAGATFATISYTHRTQSAGGQYVKYSGSVPGLTGEGVILTTIPATAPAAASTTPTLLTVLVLGTAGTTSTYCANACTSGDFSQEVEYGVTAQVAAEGFELTILAASGATSVSTTVYFEVPLSSTGHTTTNLLIYVDLTSSSPSTTFTATIQKCSSSTSCP
jgi:hypothetical protein